MYQRLGGIRDPVDLSPQEALSSAEALITQHGYNITERTETTFTAVRRKREGLFGHSLWHLTVVAQPLPQGGVQIRLRGNDREGVRARQAEWFRWGRGLPKRKGDQQQHEQRHGPRRTPLPQSLAEEPTTSRVGEIPAVGKNEETGESPPERTQASVVGGAAEPEIAVGDADGEKQRRAPDAQSEGWLSVAPWTPVPRLASSKRTASQVPPRDKPRNKSEKPS